MKEPVLDPALPAPDIAGTIEAWRVWRVVARSDGYLLGSVIKPAAWPPRRPLVADCLQPRAISWLRRRHRHAAPDERCQCGIYAADLVQIGHYLTGPAVQPAAGRVLGQVSLWGSVVECEHGFRASHAYPLRIFVPVDMYGSNGGSVADELAERLALSYGVPVELLATPSSSAVRALVRQAA